MRRIVVVGELNMDIHLFGVAESPGPAMLVADHHLAEPGGKGANVARAAARLGGEVALVGRVGSDEFGHDCVGAVAADGVDTSGVLTTPDTSTGFVAIQLDDGRHRSLVFSPGANDLLTWDDVEPVVDRLDHGDLLIVQAEVPAATLTAVCEHAVARGCPVLLDPTPPGRVGREHLAAAEVITPDLAEAAQLTGRSGGSLLWPAFAARELVEAGARRVILKLGEPGALLADATGVVQIPTTSVRARDETGAGDVFLAALAVRRVKGAGWDEAVRFANAAAAISVERMGLALPGRAEVDEAARLLVEPSRTVLPAVAAPG
ncbi:ribokinase [Actinotalea sp.]|uniref:ribokinase n=1 Tax=Actinotalea sp. TaxID=1872145 RepID=UPI003567DF40